MAKRRLKIVVSVEEYIISANYQVLNQVYTQTFDESRPIGDIIDYVLRTKTQGNVTVRLTVDGKSWSALGPQDVFSPLSAGSSEPVDSV